MPYLNDRNYEKKHQAEFNLIHVYVLYGRLCRIEPIDGWRHTKFSAYSFWIS